MRLIERLRRPFVKLYEEKTGLNCDWCLDEETEAIRQKVLNEIKEHTNRHGFVRYKYVKRAVNRQLKFTKF